MILAALVTDAAQRETPSLTEMAQRALLAQGTEYEQWAMDALAVAAAFAACQRLDEVAQLAIDQPFEASQKVHAWDEDLAARCPLSHLRMTVYDFAMNTFAAKCRAQRRDEKKALRAGAKAA